MRSHLNIYLLLFNDTSQIAVIIGLKHKLENYILTLVFSFEKLDFTETK